MINVTRTEDGIELVFPFHDEAKRRIKNLGGRWNGEAWVVQKEMEPEARQILIDAFGTDGSIEVPTVSVIVRAKRDVTAEKSPVTCCGKVLARAWGRDSGAKVGADVALLSGSIRSGGSAKYWQAIVTEGSEFKLVNVLPARVHEYDPADFEIEAAEDGEKTEVSPLAGFSDEDILAEAKRRGLI